MLEALTVGTPVLAADLPGVSEILEAQGGWIEPTRDPPAWAARLRSLLEEPSAGVEAYQAARRRYLSHFTAEKAARGVLDHGFRELGLARIVSFVEAPNRASHGVMRKLGLAVERIERLPKVELHVYAVTTDEWLGRAP